jgi:hypothetical protein
MNGRLLAGVMFTLAVASGYDYPSRESGQARAVAPDDRPHELAADRTRAVYAPGSLEVPTDELVETTFTVTSHPEGTALEFAGPRTGRRTSTAC